MYFQGFPRQDIREWKKFGKLFKFPTNWRGTESADRLQLATYVAVTFENVSMPQTTVCINAEQSRLH